jgi:hypothetical protein
MEALGRRSADRDGGDRDGGDRDGGGLIHFRGGSGKEEERFPASEQEVVAHPSRILRLAAMAQALLSQIEQLDLDEAARHRLATVFNRTVASLRELLSDDLRDEVDQLELRLPADPTSAELRVAQAQLVGWLEGLFHGIRTTIIAHNIASQEELAQAYEQGREAAEHERDRATGHYL